MRTYSIALVASRLHTLATVGNHVRVDAISSGGTVRISDRNATIDMQCRAGKWFETSEQFDALQLLSTVDCDVVIEVGAGRVGDSQVVGTVQTTDLPGSDLAEVAQYSSAAAAATTQLCASNTQRREIVLYALESNTVNVEFSSSDPVANGQHLAPGQTIIYPVNCALYAKAAAAGQLVNVLEVLL